MMIRPDFWRPKRRWRDQNIATHIWYVQTLATKSCHFQTFVTEKLSRDFRYRGGYGATLPTAQETASPARPNLTIFRLSRPRWRRCDFRVQCGYGATQETARLKKQRRNRPSQQDKKVHFQNFRDRGGGGATFQTEAETTRPRIISSRP